MSHLTFNNASFVIQATIILEDGENLTAEQFAVKRLVLAPCYSHTLSEHRNDDWVCAQKEGRINRNISLTCTPGGLHGGIVIIMGNYLRWNGGGVTEDDIRKAHDWFKKFYRQVSEERLLGVSVKHLDVELIIDR